MIKLSTSSSSFRHSSKTAYSIDWKNRRVVIVYYLTGEESMRFPSAKKPSDLIACKSRITFRSCKVPYFNRTEWKTQPYERVEHTGNIKF